MNKEHCDFFTTQDELVFRLKQGDCSMPVNGRFQPHKCAGVCDRYNDTAYKLKKVLLRQIK